jgi:nudix motif 8
MKSLSFHKQWIDRISTLCTENPRVLISSAISLKLHESKTNKKQAAVLIPLCNRNGEASVIYTLRSHKVGTHKGQVSFPGGHLDENETPVQAAIREFYEELFVGKETIASPQWYSNDDSNTLKDNFKGYHTNDLRILGVCQTIPAITGTLVTPVIAYYRHDIGDLTCFNRNENEVEQIFTRSIADLTSPQFVEYETLSRRGEPFRFPVYGAKTDHRIWGLTAIVTAGVLDNAVMPSMPSP